MKLSIILGFFLFQSISCSTQDSDTKRIISKLTPSLFNNEDLIKKHFDIIAYNKDGITLISTEDDLFGIRFHQTITYNQRGEEFALVFFGIFPLHDRHMEIEPDQSTATIGEEKISILKFKLQYDTWAFINKWDDLETGINIRGTTYLPHVIQIGDYYFLELPDIIFYAAGDKNQSTVLFNLENFKKLLEIYVSGYNSMDNVDEFVENMNIDANAQFGASGENSEVKDFFGANWNSRDYKLEYKIENKKLFVYEYEREGVFDRTQKKFIILHDTIKYKYDNKVMKFSQKY